MQKLRNVIFVIIVCAVTFCCIGNKVADRVLSIVEIPERSSLEGRAYQQFPEVNAETLSGGTFQSQFEQYVADLVPQRDSVLLANASIQHSLISCANLIPGYKAYPTFFGSNYYCTADGKYVIEAPGKASYYNEERFQKASSEFNKLFANNGNVNWFVYMADRGASSLGSPVHGQLSDTVDFDDIQKGFLNRLEGAKVIESRIDTTEEFFANRYATDHHWNARGAATGYKAIMNALGRDAIVMADAKTVFNGKFNGSATRNGLYVTKNGDTVDDTSYTPSNITIRINGKKVKLKDVDEAWGSDGGASYKKSNDFSNVYAEFFHTDYAEVHYHNDKGTGNLLVVGDSFTDCMDRFFAESYKDVWVLDQRYNKGSIQKFLDTHEVNDALILMGCTNIMESGIYSSLN